eukprot:Rmarinus@m.9144
MTDGEHTLAFVPKLCNFLSTEGFEGKITEFLEENLHRIPETTCTEGMGLDVYTLYKEYISCVECALVGFLEEHDLTIDEFQSTCKNAISEGKEAVGPFLSALVGSWDFDQFLDLAVGFKEEQEEDSDETNSESRGEIGVDPAC